MTIFRRSDREKLMRACTSFGCEPWIAIYVEVAESAELYLTSLDHYDETYSSSSWKMAKKSQEKYSNDSKVKNVHIDFHQNVWWKPLDSPQGP